MKFLPHFTVTNVAAVMGGGGAVPTISVAPVISGNQQVAQTLSTTDGTWNNSPSSFTYQWKRDGSSIGAATANTYLLVELDAGAAMTCEVTAHNASGDSSPSASNSLTTDVLVVFLTHIEDTSDATTYNGASWQGVSFGTAAANRHIVVGFSVRSATSTVTFSSGTIGGIASAVVSDGVTQAKATNGTSGGNFAGLLIAAVPTGTTGNISTTLDAASVRAGGGVWAMYGAANIQASTSANSTANDPTSTQTIPAGGAAIGVGMTGAVTTSTPAGVAEDYDANVEASISHTGGHLNTHAGGSTAMTFDWLSPTNSAGAFASWAP